MNQSANLDPQMQEAVELHRLLRLPEAEAAYRSIIERQPHNADAHHLLGVLLHQSGHPDQGVELIERAIAILPDSAQYYASLGRAFHALSHYERATVPLRRAAELQPGNAQAWSDLGAVLQADDQDDEAEAMYRRAMSLDPRLVGNRYNLATVLKKKGELAPAVTLMQAVVADVPDFPMINTMLAGYLLESDRVPEALAACESAFQVNPRDLLAMTFKSVALHRGGDDAGADALVDLERFIHVETVQAPPGYASIEAFNEQLAAQVRSHPTLKHERQQNATRHGLHTDNLLLGRVSGPVAELRAVLDGAVRRYLNGLPRDAAHPYLAYRPEAWRLQAWAVVMNSQGHQLAHTHPDGWVSGVYYARVPESIRDDDPDQAGWIEFGRPLPQLLGDAPPRTRRLRPASGMLVLFPSYFYHETVPFAGDEQRISIAFDATPTAGEGHVEIPKVYSRT